MDTTAENQRILDEVLAAVRPLAAGGTVASYIPALAEVSPDRLAITTCIGGHDGPGSPGDPIASGDADIAFSIQSIAKVFALTLALQAGCSDQLWERIGREPSGDPFNSVVLLEHEGGIPRNPFINAGAIVVDDLLHARVDDPGDALLSLISELAGADVAVDDAVAASEAATGDRNRSMAYLMASFGRVEGDVETVLDFYFRQSSISMTTRQLARAIRFLANDGVDPGTGRVVVDPLDARRINALMLMAGTYDAAGAFAFEVGIPCKSGVGGGIIGVVPDKASICVWSPPLDSTGNSLAGRAAMAEFVNRSGLTVF